jgi:hypothetical protein
MTQIVWNEDMKTAPRNGTLLLLVVQYHGNDGNPLEDKEYARTVGHNSREHDGEDRWEFAGWSWEQDCFTQGDGVPVKWALFPDAPPGFDV